MIKGLDTFTQSFANWTDHYVLIGGTAASLTMHDQGLKFRATKDLDVVLIVEALTADCSPDPKSLKINAKLDEILTRIAGSFGLT